MKLVWNALDEADWQRELPASACALQQSWAYGATVQAMGGQVQRAEIFSDMRRVALVQLVQRQFWGMATASLMSRGPIWIDALSENARAQALGKLRRSILGSGFRLLLATPEDHMRRNLPLYSACCVAELDLRPKSEAIRRGFYGKWRNALRRAEAAGLRISTSKKGDDLAGLIQRDVDQQRRNGYRNLPAKFLANWAGLYPDGFCVFRAFMGPDCIAEMLFLDHPPGVTYQAGWTSGAGRAFNAHHLLLWRAIQSFVAAGRLRLDLGHLDTVNAPGVARFKLGTGANVRRLGETGLVLPRMPWARAS